MHWKTFLALTAHDGHVARRNFLALLLHIFLLPMLFLFIFGKGWYAPATCPPHTRACCFGIIAICMVFIGVWTEAMPLIAEFQFTCVIEDRLTGPIEISWLAIE
jgi:hypothetical protein